MIPTPIATVGCSFTEETAGDVARWHIVATFAPSFLTGVLVKRFGAQSIAMIGLVTLVAAAAVAAIDISAAHSCRALIVLGIGWIFGFVGATPMLDAALVEGERGAVQAANDTIIALVSMICAIAAGSMISSQSWPRWRCSLSAS